MLPEDFLPILDEVNRIVKASGSPLEGNLFYFHHQDTPGRENIYTDFYPKRRNFVAACRQSTHLLEVGFNAGHAALLALACGLEYHGVDICRHSYSRPVATYLRSLFGDRFHFHDGDSLKVLPRLRTEQPYLRFNMVHIDGNHSYDHTRSDIANAIPLSLRRAWFIINDAELPSVKQAYKEQLEKGFLLEGAPAGWEPFDRHSVAKAA